MSLLPWLLACPPAPSFDTGANDGPPEADCLDGIDDNRNGLTDCADPDCLSVCDQDGDGFLGTAVGGDDCDDTLSFVHPAAREVCNGLDDDCDRLADDQDVDLDLSTRTEWHPDVDGDGYGARFDWVTLCRAPANHLRDGSDCDDGNPLVHPGAVEVCGSGDDDCDGLYDEDDDGLDMSSLLTWYRDADGDGLGDPDASTLACEQPAAHVPDASDCDDADADVPALFWFDGDHDGTGVEPTTPEATCDAPGDDWIPVASPEDCDDSDPQISPLRVEQCDNKVDDDCSGRLLLCGIAGDFSLAVAGALVPAPAGAVGFGRAAAGGLDLDGDAIPDVLVGSVGAAHVFSALDLAEIVDPELAVATFEGEPGDDAFSTVDIADVDGDGRADVLVGGPGDADGGADAGAAWLVRGPFVGAVDLEADAQSKWLGSANFALVAFGVTGDLSGDAARDVVFGAPGADFGLGAAGAVFVAPLVSGAMGPIGSLSSARVAGPAVDTGVGTASAALGDGGGDGTESLLVGAPGDDFIAENSGRVVLFAAPVTGNLTFADAALEFRGAGKDMALGSAVIGSVDFDGDGDLDVAASGTTADEVAGAVWGWADPDDVNTVLDASFTMAGEDNLAAGARLQGRDLDGDGLADLVIGNDASASVAASSGRTWLVYAPFSGVVDLQTDASARLFGEGADAASAVAAMDDFNGDGVADLLIGGPGADAGAGAAWILGGGLP